MTDLFEEFRIYHRKDGRLVKERDDLMDPTRYVTMMVRFARVDRGGMNRRRRPVIAHSVDYDVFDSVGSERPRRRRISNREFLGRD